MFVEIKTPLPGPKSKALIERDQAVMSPSYTRDYPLVIDRGEGATVYDPDGNKFLDMAAGIAVCATGHSHPKVVEAIKHQAERFLHMSGTDFFYDTQVELAERLVQVAPVRTKSGRKRVFFTNSGAEAVEASMKLSRYKTGRSQFIAFYGSFHGRTLGALSLTASKTVQKKGFFPFIPGVTHIPFGYCYRCPYGQTNDPTTDDVTCNLACVDFLEDPIFRCKVDPRDVAAIIIEPIQGEGGYIVPPKKFMQGIRKICDKYGILLVMDEIQAGMGRTGKWFGCEHFGVEPDIICVAKGLASGMPLGGIITGEEIMTWEYGAHASTFGGNPVACAAAVATFDLIKDQLMDNVNKVGKVLMEELKPLVDKYDVVGDVRGKGLMVGVEFITDKKTKKRNADFRNKLVLELFYEGLLILGCGPNCLRFAPPLTLSEEEARFAVELVDKTIQKMVK